MARSSKKKSDKKSSPKKPDPLKKEVVMGRPTIFTEELANLICERVATHTFGLKKLCATYDDMPNPDTINLWRYKYDNFSVHYMRAKAMQAQLLADEVMDIADDGTNDWMESLGEDGTPIGWKLNGEHVARSRLRIDARKWHASKLAPKIYGNQIESDDQKEQREKQERLNQRVNELLNDKTKP